MFPAVPDPARPPTRIAVAVVLRRGRDGRFWVLIGRRLPHAHLPECWEFPGGECLPGEPEEECARRETLEETGLCVEVVAPLAEFRHDFRERALRLRFLLCADRGGVPEARGSRVVRWVRPDNLDAYRFPDPNRPILEWLQGPAASLLAALDPARRRTPADP